MFRKRSNIVTKCATISATAALLLPGCAWGQQPAALPPSQLPPGSPPIVRSAVPPGAGGPGPNALNQNAAQGTSDSPIPTIPNAAGSLASTTESSSEPLHLLVGRSIFIKTATRLRRVYVSNPAAVDSFTSSPYQIVVTAKAPGVSSLILWDEAGQSQTYFISSDVDVSQLQHSIQQALPNENVRVEAAQNLVALSGTVTSDAASDLAVKLASLYSKDVANSLLVSAPHTKQVKLKVQIVEVDRSKMDAFGINLFSNGKNSSNSTTGQFPSTTTLTTANSGSGSGSGGSGGGSASGLQVLTYSDPLNLLYYNFGVNVGAIIKDLQDKQILEILAEPTITTLSGQKASFLSGGEFPFPVVQGSATGSTTITIQFRSYGVKLDFTPVVNVDGTVELKVAPEVSALDYTNAVSISGYTIPAISTRRAETQVELRSGQSFAISGLLDHRTTDILSKMPGIGDVPILGQLFRSKSITRSVVELVVIVTPMVVDPLTETTEPSLPKFSLPNLDSGDFDKGLKQKDFKQPTLPQAQEGTPKQ